MKKFDLGQLVVTRGVADRMDRDICFKMFVRTSLIQYVSGDWGDLSDEDKKSNEDALKNEERILGSYIYSKDKTKIWIITEWDRSITTILFPDEY